MIIGSIRKISLIIGASSLASLQVVAQVAPAARDTAIKGATIEVIQSYKPEVKQRPKQDYAPVLPPVDNALPVFKYVVPQQTLNYSYNSLPLRPLALGKDTTLAPYSNYVKLGGGNLSTLFLDAGVGSLKGKDFETAFHLHSISQKGKLKDQQSSLTDFKGDGTWHKSGRLWHGYLDAMRNQYNYYGFNHDVFNPAADSIKQVFTSVKVGADMQEESNEDLRFTYHPGVYASVYADKYHTTETSFNLNAPFYYQVDSTISLQIAANGTFTQYKNTTHSFGNNILQFDPGINFHGKSFSAHAYISPAIGSNNFYVLPDLGANYSIPRTLFTISAGWQAKLRQNTYEQLTTENPYIFNSFVAGPVAYSPLQTRSDEVFGGLQTNLGNHLSLSGRISWWQYDHLPVFVSAGDQKQFNVVYDDHLNATSLQASLAYKVSAKFSADVQVVVFTYFSGSLTRAWEQPGVRLRGTLQYRPIPALTVTAYANALDQTYVLNANGSQMKLDPTLDIGGNAEYTIIPRLSVFLQVNNLLNNKNERWLNYQAYGANVYGGLTFRF